MEGIPSTGPSDSLRRLTLSVGVLVAAVVVLTWYVFWSTSDLSMSLLMTSPTGTDPVLLALFVLLILVMMVAMMLPSALPMLLAYRGMTRLEEGRPSRRPDDVATTLFASTYFVVWGAFGVLALLGIMGLGLAGLLSGAALLVPAVVLLAAGGYQFTRTKQACLAYCRSPMGFMLAHWRDGREGALRMGVRHAAYCLGCCWLFMIALFVTGAMSLLWMGALSVAIFAEKVGPRQQAVSRAIAVILFVLGGLLLAEGIRTL